jgi:hypothetical protein
VDPLVVSGGGSEQIHAPLGDFHPIGGAQRVADEVEEIGWFLEVRCH